MRGELGNRVAREGVALDEHRAVGRDGDVPRDEANLRHAVHRGQTHGLDLVPVGNLRAGDALAGHRVNLERLAGLVRADAADDAGVQIDGGRHAAAVHVVHHLAVADADVGVDDALLLVAQQRGDADGIDGRGAERGDGLVLDDLVLDDADSRGLEALIERGGVGVLLGRALEDALSAGAVDGLADDVAPALQERSELRLGRGGQVEPIAPHLLAEQLVELGLVIEEMPELLVVHPRDDAVGDAAGDLRGALRVVQAVHFSDLVIDIAGVVPRGALRHIRHEPDAALAGLFMQHIGGAEHRAIVHLRGALHQIGESVHGKPSFPRQN